MAIKKNFGGQTLRKPGAYSKTQTSPDAGTATISNDTIFLIGEADAGKSGAVDGVQAYTASGYNQLAAKYKSGPLVDAAKICLSPSRTPGIGGAGRILIYQTNTPVAATLALANTYATIQASEYGVGGNRVTYINTLSSESAISTTSSADITAFGGLDTQTLEVRVNGGAKTTITYATPANIAAVVAQTVISGITASNDGDKLILTLDAATNHHRDGYGRSFEILSTSTALANLNLSAGLQTAEDEPQATIIITQPRDGVTEQNTIGGVLAMSVGRDATDSATAATITITDTQCSLTATGSTTNPTATLTFENYPTIGLLAEAINALPGWTATALPTVKNTASSSLDEVASLGVFSEDGSLPGLIKRDAELLKDIISASSIVELTGTEPETGLPDAEGRYNLSGGAKGSSSSSSFDAGFSASLGETFNVALPCISQDASVDILAGLTDAASTYDIETVHAMLDTHLRLRGNIKNRKEAQGVIGYRKSTKADVYTQAGVVGSELIQLCLQDCLVVDSSNTLQWKQPHIFAAALAGMRLGSDVGEPLTHKFLAVSGVGHFVNTATGIAAGDFDPEIDYDEAIDAGVTFAEPFAGGFRVTVDNTTYGVDENFVFNRGSVVEAAQYIAKFIRTDAETSFVGKKNAVVKAGIIKARVRTKLIELFNSQITSPSNDAPQGFVEETFVVTVTGNTAEVKVEVKPVQGLDFVLITFTLGDTQTSA